MTTTATLYPSPHGDELQRKAHYILYTPDLPYPSPHGDELQLDYDWECRIKAEYPSPHGDELQHFMVLTLRAARGPGIRPRMGMSCSAMA